MSKKFKSRNSDQDFDYKRSVGDGEPQESRIQKYNLASERPRRTTRKKKSRSYAEDLEQQLEKISRNEGDDDQVNQEPTKQSSKQEKIKHAVQLDSRPIEFFIWKRTRKGTNQDQFLSKFRGKSYRDCQWLTKEQIHQTCTTNIGKKLKNFIEKFYGILEKGEYDKIAIQNGQYFDQNYVQVDRILSTTQLFPYIHVKKAGEIKGQWYESLQLVCSKLLNFVKENNHYGVQFMSFVKNIEDKTMVNKVDLGVVLNKVYLGVYKNYEQFWIDIGKVWRNHTEIFGDSGKNIKRIKNTMIEASLFLYYQWYHLSEDRYSKMRKQIRQNKMYDISDSEPTPQEKQFQRQKEQKPKQTNQTSQMNDINTNNTNKLQNTAKKTNQEEGEEMKDIEGEEQDNQSIEMEFLDIGKFSRDNILLTEKKSELPLRKQQLMKFDPGDYNYKWLVEQGQDPKKYLDYQYQYLDITDMQQLDLNKQPDILYLVKWKNLSYRESTWQKASSLDYPQAFTQFKNFNKALNKQLRTQFEKDRTMHLKLLASNYKNSSQKKLLEKQMYCLGNTKKQLVKYNNANAPVFKNGKMLRSYQLDGLNWLVKSWHEDRNVILGDEMGLGKTMQTIAFLHHLLTYENVKGPFLVIVPLTTLLQWKRAFQEWTNMNCVAYHDQYSEAGRKTIRYYEWYSMTITLQGHRLPSKCNKFRVLLTTYEMLKTDYQNLRQIPFKQIIIDEAHRLKGRNCQNLQILKSFPCKRKLLLTGTPIQNNTQQIWTLLNFIQPDQFFNLSMFQKKYGNLETEEQLKDFTTALKPYLLRRMKEDVQKSIPPIQEIIIDVELTNMQKTYYKGLYEKNKGKIISSLSKTSFNAMEMQLRKCCNHPFLISQAVQDQIVEFCKNDEEVKQKLVTSSGKMVLLKKLLSKFKEQEKKVLIFSQFTSMLDILQKYLKLAGFIYERFDGSTPNSQRMDAIDRFNHPDKKRDVFLISTKAGGVGSNLTSATAIIIYDSDWNPQNDTQAIARAHRIGQTNEVIVYRLVTSKTYEAEMFERASKKLGLDKAIMYGGDFKNSNQLSKMSKTQLQTLLKKGIVGLIAQDNNEQFFERNIDQILEKNTRLIKYEIAKNSGSSISKSRFIGDNTNAELQLNDPDFWIKALKNNQEMMGQKLLKTFKQFKGQINLQKQRDFMINVVKVMDAVIQSKKSLQNYSLDEENRLQECLALVNSGRKFHAHYRNLAQSWMQDVQRPPRRYKKPTNEDLQIPNANGPRRPTAAQRRKKNYAQQPIKEDTSESNNTSEEEEDIEVLKEKMMIPCQQCELPYCTYFCNGLCGRAFHQLCKQNHQNKKPKTQSPLTDIKQLNEDYDSLLKKMNTKYICIDCSDNVVRCHICQKAGKYNPQDSEQLIDQQEEKKIQNQLLPCSRCDKFYHAKCIKSAQVGPGKRLLFHFKKNKKKQMIVICSNHYCNQCQKGTGTITTCFRCPRSHHLSCADNQSIIRYFGKYCLCQQHFSNKEQIKEKMEMVNRFANKKKIVEDKKVKKKKQQQKQAPTTTQGKKSIKKKEQQQKTNAKKNTKQKQDVQRKLLTYEEFGILKPETVDYEKLKQVWCRYCGARFSASFIDTKVGQKTLCKGHETKKQIIQGSSETIKKPLYPQENKQLQYLNDFANKHKSWKPDEVITAAVSFKRIKKN